MSKPDLSLILRQQQPVKNKELEEKIQSEEWRFKSIQNQFSSMPYDEQIHALKELYRRGFQYGQTKK